MFRLAVRRLEVQAKFRGHRPCTPFSMAATAMKAGSWRKTQYLHVYQRGNRLNVQKETGSVLALNLFHKTGLGEVLPCRGRGWGSTPPLEL